MIEDPPNRLTLAVGQEEKGEYHDSREEESQEVKAQEAKGQENQEIGTLSSSCCKCRAHC